MWWEGGDGAMLKFKSCPKCRGDILLDRDEWGWYEQCIQCGYLRDVPGVVRIEPELIGAGRRKKKESTPRLRKRAS
jgi:ssDNA-binding Zn-finger/Zn-ribbon topoisomerase 1